MRRSQIPAVVAAVFVLFSIARAGTIFFESWALERGEREQDAELLQLCQEGRGRGSEKMRGACLAAASSRATPIFLKAVTRSISRAFSDFRDNLNSPLAVLSAILFVVSSMILPVSSWLRLVVSAFGEEQDLHRDEDLEKRHVICFTGDDIVKPGFRGRFKRLTCRT